MEGVLEQFYLLHNPSKIKDIPKILRHYKGAEAVLLHDLATKYGDPCPTALSDWVVVVKPHEPHETKLHGSHRHAGRDGPVSLPVSRHGRNGGKQYGNSKHEGPQDR